jgi:DHA2 family multidrug resistance protein
VLAPGGIASMIAMLIAGRLITKINPKAILAFGIATAAYSIHLMSQFSVQADFNTIVWPRVGMSVGLGFLFIPLTTMVLSNIRKEEMGNATGIFNLLRNLRGSFGVAIITTMLARREQFHQAHLMEYITLFDHAFRSGLPQVSGVLHDRGYSPLLLNQASLKAIETEIARQASMLSFNDAFHILSIMIASILPLILLMRKGNAHGTRPSME